MEQLLDQIQGVIWPLPGPPGDNAHRAVTKEASREEGGRGLVLIAKFESQRDGFGQWRAPSVTGDDQEFCFLQGWNLGDSEEIVFIEKKTTNYYSISFSFHFCIEQSKLISMRVKAQHFDQQHNPAEPLPICYVHPSPGNDNNNAQFYRFQIQTITITPRKTFYRFQIHPFWLSHHSLIFSRHSACRLRHEVSKSFTLRQYSQRHFSVVTRLVSQLSFVTIMAYLVHAQCMLACMLNVCQHQFFRLSP